MGKLNTIEFSNNDYLINGFSLLEHLAKHEGVGHHLTAVECEPLALDRLIGKVEPDLSFGFTALYLCGMCGGYDGSPIGAKIIVDENTVSWTDLGWCTDTDEESSCSSFKKVREFSFDKKNYEEFISQAYVYKAKWYP